MRKFLWIFSFLLPQKIWAAACCGGGLAAPAMILGDEKAQLTSAYQYRSEVIAVGDDDLWRKLDSQSVSQTYRFEGAHIIADVWQMGISIPVIQKTTAGQNGGSALGDVALVAAYEALPDWDYNPYRPKGIVFLQVTAPTGRSLEESRTPGLTDVTGRGVWSLGSGIVLTKNFSAWDSSVQLEGHRVFSRNVNSSQGPKEYPSKIGLSLGAGIGYNFHLVRLGAAALINYDEPSRGSLERITTATLSAGYQPTELWNITCSYSDQTVLGSPSNTTLGKNVSLSLQRKWQR